MGAPVAVLTSKHEAGYIIWQTDEPIGRNFSIAKSSTVPSRDLVDEFTRACREVGVLPGLYFTTTDAYQTSLNNSQDVFRKAQLQQIEELSTRYGEISYFWFDHHQVTSSADLWFDIDNLVRVKQPGAVILGMDSQRLVRVDSHLIRGTTLYHGQHDCGDVSFLSCLFFSSLSF